MATAASLRDIARRLESEVERHGCDRLACDLCHDVEEALAPQPERHTSRPASVRRTGEPRLTARFIHPENVNGQRW